MAPGPLGWGRDRFRESRRHWIGGCMHIDIGKPVLGKNDELADANRRLLDRNRVYAVNLLASPGSGKTSTILALFSALGGRLRFGVVEGDIASKVDAVKIKEHGIPCVQINTGGICHLESKMIAKALDALDLDEIDVLFIENVGNLVCPANFRLGEHCKLVVLSIPEGHDKPVKYPGIFQAADAVVLNKVDVRDVFDFDEEEFRASMSDINPQVGIFPISAKKGEGVEALAAWLESKVNDYWEK